MRLFRKRESQDEKLIRNIKRYEKEKYSDKYKTDKLIELRKEIRDLENKLDTIKRIADYE